MRGGGQPIQGVQPIQEVNLYRGINPCRGSVCTVGHLVKGVNLYNGFTYEGFSATLNKKIIPNLFKDNFIKTFLEFLDRVFIIPSPWTPL